MINSLGTDDKLASITSDKINNQYYDSGLSIILQFLLKLIFFLKSLVLYLKEKKTHAHVNEDQTINFLY